MKKTPRIVGIDYGTKRVGLAVADPLSLFAQPCGAVPPPQVVATLKEIRAQAGGLSVLVVGWPLTLAGEEGRATARVQRFIDQLRKAFPESKIVKRDERHTSEMARDAIRDYGLRRSGWPDKGRVDAAAAAIILQDFLEERR